MDAATFCVTAPLWMPSPGASWLFLLWSWPSRSDGYILCTRVEDVPDFAIWRVTLRCCPCISTRVGVSDRNCL
ncbi:UNVERIFIED_CONTAM: hypothetical protein K2H54_018481 [Gekko kuhli]